MRKGFYSRLALQNIKNNRRLYVPYILSCMCTIAMFYIMMFLSGHSALGAESSIGIVLGLGCIVIGIFAVILVLYSNSFLMKRRNRELALYNILGMEKKHVARIMATETLYTGFFSVAAGIGLGILFSKLMLLMLCALLKFDVPYGFEVSVNGITASLILFAGIFLVALIYNVGRVGFSRPIELLHSSDAGEREPRVKWLLVVLGVITLGAGYTIAVITTDPALAVVVFFVAVILVIIGTYCLFTAGSIALLKALRKNKKYYYQTRHFTAVSGMLYRMKQNAAGLATICILSTMVLVMLSTTICLYSGMEDAVRAVSVHDTSITCMEVDDSTAAMLSSKMDDAVKESGVYTQNRSVYRRSGLWAAMDQAGKSFYSLDDAKKDDATVLLVLIPLRDYNSLFGTNETLAENEILVCSSTPLADTVLLGNREFSVKGSFPEFPFYTTWDADTTEYDYIVMQDTSLFKDVEDSILAEGVTSEGYTLYYGVDTDSPENEQKLIEALTAVVYTYTDSLPEDSDFVWSHNCASDTRNGFLGLYGGLLFLGIFLGLMFSFAAVLIMYYKQISEGYDDRGRFEIMQNVGMSLAEVKGSIRSQVLTVFFLPLGAAGVHLAFAFPLIATLFVILRLTNTHLFFMCTLVCYAVFALLYAGVYALTARTYYRIVK